MRKLMKTNNNDSWQTQVWGFEIMDGKRYYVRHVVVRKEDDWKQARLVYDYHG